MTAAAARLSEQVIIYDDIDVIEVCGQKISGDLLRSFSSPTPEGIWFRFIRREDGVLAVENNLMHERDKGTIQ